MRIAAILALCAGAVAVVGGARCPQGKVWDECGSPCDATCDNLYPICIAQCMPKCECPEDAPVLFDGECIPQHKCPEAECPQLRCAEPCDGGYLQDARGCQTCQCTEEPRMGEVRAQGDQGVECPEIECPNHCPSGYKDDKDGCTLCDCREYDIVQQNLCESVECSSELVCKVFTLTLGGHRIARCINPSWPAPCQFPMDQGPCRSFKSRWYYDEGNHECMEYSYGGCKGNCNNFQTKEACEHQCMADPAITCTILQCDMECAHGLFALDDRGCYVCKCGDSHGREIVEEKAKCPEPMPMCMMECDRGFKKDGAGCPVCECADDAACAVIDCFMYCPYGFMKDDYGCKVCFCAEDPCSFEKCDDGHVCQSKQVGSGDWMAQCVEPEEGRVWCEAGPMCLVECEHGFAQNSFGCPICECRDAPPSCNLNECGSGECDFGYKFDKDGCRSCVCLPDPCTMKACGEKLACDRHAISSCATCPHTAQCIDGFAAHRVTVRMNFGHGMMDDEEFNQDEFIREFERRASKIMGIDDEYIRDVKLKFEESGEVSILFHVITYGEIDIVEAYNRFREKVAQHEPGTAVPIAGVDFLPIHESLKAEYSSQTSYQMPENFDDEGEGEELEGDMTMTVIIVACACGAAIFILVLVILIVTLRRARVNNKDIPVSSSRPTSTAIYKKAPTSDPSRAKSDPSRPRSDPPPPKEQPSV